MNTLNTSTRSFTAKKLLLFVMAIAIAVFLSGCAGPNLLEGTGGDYGIAGFWAGLWHGIISPITFIISLFNHNISIYEVNNSGILYNLGFLLGISLIFGGGGAASTRR